ncbi:thiamine ABC transporter ATP-binding protein [Labrys neptuniae]
MLVADRLTITIDDWTGCYDLAVPRGTLAAMVGPSGGGKSTLLHAIAGFERPESGTLSFEGRDLLPLKPAARPVAIVFQDHNLLPNLNALQNAGLALSPSLRLSAADRAAISAMLEHVGLAGLEARLPSELSGGQRQRVALARAMLTTRPLLLLDEPLTGLDPAMRADMVELIDTLRREKQLTVVMTTHTPEDVDGRADQVITVADGRVVA